MSVHESFEQLCALAITGDLEPDEFRRLGEHLYECETCRAAYRDFHAIVARGFPVMEAARAPGWSLPPWGMKKRLVRRADKEGIRISQPRKSSNVRAVLIPATVALLVIILLGYGSYVYRSFQQRQRDAANQIARLSTKVRELERRLSDSATVPEPATAQPQTVSADHEEELKKELLLLRGDYDAAVTGKKELENRVAALSSELDRFGEGSQTMQREVERLQGNLSAAEATLTRANGELESLRTSRSNDAATIAQQRARLNELAAAAREQTDTISRDRQLLAAGKDIRDLMGARNLRIVDVNDDGTAGKVRPLAGRIFYTQGKSLIFYAYDLQNKGNVSRVDFQVWGKKEGRSQPARSLGILYIDEPAQNRWTLKFENPEVLAQIDQVFVTVEPHGGSEQPTGKHLLTAAFLNESPNHP